MSASPPKLALRDRLAAAAWVLGVVQNLICQLIAGAAWKTGYSWSRNNVSDLGNVLCQTWDEDHPRYVCSPLHAMVNLSFLTEGLLLALGVWLAAAIWRRGASAVTARILITLAGAGWVLAGLYPADVNLNIHLIGAVLIFFVGNAALLLIVRAAAPGTPRLLRALAGLGGLVGLTTAVSFLSGHYLGLGMGGLERFAAYPLEVWTIAAAVWLASGRRDRAVHHS
ncbi:MAG TPA: DUF998 domain-containing protein [Caulobacteraceae bacterium]